MASCSSSDLNLGRDPRNALGFNDVLGHFAGLLLAVVAPTLAVVGYTRQAHSHGGSVSVRTAGQRGRLPVKPQGERFAIGYVHSYLTQPLPAPVYPVDVSGGITDWLMLGNGPDPSVPQHPDGVGDCTFAGREHYQMAKAAAGAPRSSTGRPPPSSSPSTSPTTTGRMSAPSSPTSSSPGTRPGKILAFAPVDHTDPAAVDSAMAAFHGAYVRR